MFHCFQNIHQYLKFGVVSYGSIVGIMLYQYLKTRWAVVSLITKYGSAQNASVTPSIICSKYLQLNCRTKCLTFKRKNTLRYNVCSPNIAYESDQLYFFAQKHVYQLFMSMSISVVCVSVFIHIFLKYVSSVMD